MLTIDGSSGEGGGQILRTSLSLAALTGTDVTIESIRAGREKPGLRPQHLTAVLAVAEICGGEVNGAEVGSTKLTLKPHTIKSGSYEFDVARIRASAGSVNLVLQAILWPLALAGEKSRVTIRGGTHVPFAPTSNYIQETFLPAVGHMGLICNYRTIQAGYYPAGGGGIRAEISPVESIKPFDLSEKTGEARVELTSTVSNLPLSIAERQMNAGAERMRTTRMPFSQQTKQYPSPGKGTLFFISYACGDVRAGFQSLGEIGKPAEKVARDACDEFEAYARSETALDKHLADQLVVPMGFASGPSRFTTCEITQHLLTNVAVVERFLPVRFRVTGSLGRPGSVETATR